MADDVFFHGAVVGFYAFGGSFCLHAQGVLFADGGVEVVLQLINLLLQHITYDTHRLSNLNVKVALQINRGTQTSHITFNSFYPITILPVQIRNPCRE